jgi:AbrB family looped-hinge helix DNA binding protein
MREKNIRNVLVVGGSTLVVSLPKKWAEEIGIRPGSQVVLEREKDKIAVIPLEKYKEPMKEKKAIIRINGKNTNSVSRLIISSYINGYKEISLVDNNGITIELRNSIKELLKRKIVGSEIILDSPTEVKIKVLVNQEELPLINAFRRMYFLTKNMIEDAGYALLNWDIEKAMNVLQLDDEVDRFGFYIVRLLNTYVENPNASSEIGIIDLKEALGYRVVVKFLERIADHASNISKFILESEKKIDELILNRLHEMYKVASEMFEYALTSFMKKDYELAEKTISKAKTLSVNEKELEQAMVKAPAGLHPYVRIIYESIKRIIDYSSDIAEVTIDLNIEKVLDKL